MKLSVEDWLVEIDNALEYRRIFGREEKWDSLERSYLNDPNSDAAIGPNLIFAMGDSLMSSLAVPNPEIVVSAEHPAGVDRAPVVERVDNWLIGELDLQDAVEAMVLHMYLYGRGIIKIGYDSEFGWSPYYDIGPANNLMGMTLTQFGKKGQRIETKNITPGMPWVAPVLPHDFVVPWGTVRLEDAPWCAHRVVRLNEHIKSDPKYKNKSRLEPQISMQSFMESYRKLGKRQTEYGAQQNTKALYNVLWEIHDRMTGRIIVVSPDYDEFLRDEPDAMQVCGLPFVSGTLVRHPRAFWSTPQSYYIGQIQHTSFDIALQSEKQRRISMLKFLANKDAMSTDELTKLISGDVGAVGLVKGNRPLSDTFMAFPQGNMMELTFQAEATRRDARDAVGYSRNQMGEFDTSSRRTAREATFVNQGSQMRTSKRMNVVGRLYIETIRKLNYVSFTFWKLPRFAMVGSDWVKFTGEELRGDYLYDISLSTKRQLSRSQRKLEAIMMMSQLIGLPNVNIPELYRYVLDAASDPGFERILGQGAARGGAAPGGASSSGAAPGALPTIPATKTTNQ